MENVLFIYLFLAVFIPIFVIFLLKEHTSSLSKRIICITASITSLSIEFVIFEKATNPIIVKFFDLQLFQIDKFSIAMMVATSVWLLLTSTVFSFESNQNDKRESVFMLIIHMFALIFAAIGNLEILSLFLIVATLIKTTLRSRNSRQSKEETSLKSGYLYETAIDLTICFVTILLVRLHLSLDLPIVFKSVETSESVSIYANLLIILFWLKLKFFPFCFTNKSTGRRTEDLVLATSPLELIPLYFIFRLYPLLETVVKSDLFLMIGVLALIVTVIKALYNDSVKIVSKEIFAATMLLSLLSLNFLGPHSFFATYLALYLSILMYLCGIYIYANKSKSEHGINTTFAISPIKIPWTIGYLSFLAATTSFIPGFPLVTVRNRIASYLFSTGSLTDMFLGAMIILVGLFYSLIIFRPVIVSFSYLNRDERIDLPEDFEERFGFKLATSLLMICGLLVAMLMIPDLFTEESSWLLMKYLGSKEIAEVTLSKGYSFLFLGFTLLTTIVFLSYVILITKRNAHNVYVRLFYRIAKQIDKFSLSSLPLSLWSEYAVEKLYLISDYLNNKLVIPSFAKTSEKLLGITESVRNMYKFNAKIESFYYLMGFVTLAGSIIIIFIHMRGDL